MKTAINIRLDNDLIQILDYTAKEMNLNRTKLIERAILAYQDKMDEMLKWPNTRWDKSWKEKDYSLWWIEKTIELGLMYSLEISIMLVI